MVHADFFSRVSYVQSKSLKFNHSQQDLITIQPDHWRSSTHPTIFNTAIQQVLPGSFAARPRKMFEKRCFPIGSR